MSERTCSFPGCEERHDSHGYCQMHAARWRRHGSPEQRGPVRISGALEERLWTRVDRSDSCWTWTGPTNGKGYGQLGIGKRKLFVHRLAWELTNGPIPDGLCVLHRCDNPPCCRPEHLFLGTKGDNNQDCRSKGRHGYGKLPVGQDNNTAKLTDEQVLDLRRRYAARERIAQLARELGVNRSTALRAATGRAWRHLG